MTKQNEIIEWTVRYEVCGCPGAAFSSVETKYMTIEAPSDRAEAMKVAIEKLDSLGVRGTGLWPKEQDSRN